LELSFQRECQVLWHLQVSKDDDYDSLQNYIKNNDPLSGLLAFSLVFRK